MIQIPPIVVKSLINYRNWMIRKNIKYLFLFSRGFDTLARQEADTKRAVKGDLTSFSFLLLSIQIIGLSEHLGQS